MVIRIAICVIVVAALTAWVYWIDNKPEKKDDTKEND